MIFHVTVKLKTGASFGKYKGTVRDCKAIFGKHGWKLLASYATVVGRTNTYVNVWDVPSQEAVQAGMFDPGLADVVPRVRELVEEEVTSLMMAYTVD